MECADISKDIIMAQYGFGAGIVWAAATTDAYGNPLTSPTPTRLGVLQDVSIDVHFDTKMLYGSNQFPVAIGRGKGKVSGKAKFAQLNGLSINSLFFGQTLTSKQLSYVNDTNGVLVPAAAPYAITPTVPNSGAWARDMGVIDANGNPLVKVVSSPTAGQYSVANGVYTFAAADAGLIRFINFQFTATSSSSQLLNVKNLPMGYAPSFGLDLFNPYQGNALSIQLPNCFGTKMAFATKLDDFLVPEFDFEAAADPVGNVAYLGTSA
jgi:hypothetical protein